MTNIAIIGGGIGGLTAALALRQFGFEPEVFEQAPAFHDVGAAIAVWPNAMRILEWLGIAGRVMEKAGLIRRVRWLDRDGRLLNHVRIHGTRSDAEATNRARQTDSPAAALHRADLQSILLQALPSTSIHLREAFLGQQQAGEKIEVHFAGGDSIACDVLIGADGIHSRVREQLVDTTPPTDRGYSVWRGISPVRPKDFEANTAVEIHGRGQRFGIGPLDLGRTGWWATANRSVNDTPVLSERHADEKSHTDAENPSASRPDNTQSELLKMFEDWCHPVLELLKTTPSNSILRTEAFDRPSNRNWGGGSLTLLGDAIHPTTPNLGQGGCMAIEDAFLLARCLHKYGVTEHALRTYERVRYPRTAAVTRYSRLYGVLGQWENTFAVGLRGQILSLLPETLMRRLMRIVFDYDANQVR